MAVLRSTRAELEHIVASLRGRSIAGVRYALLAADHGEVQLWDHAAAHEPTFGCQLTLDDGVEVTFTWGESFGWPGLEAFRRPVDDFVRNVGEEWGPVIVPVGGHPRWQALLGREITGTELVFSTWSSPGTDDVPKPVPSWVRLDLAGGSAGEAPDGTPDAVWIAAGRWEPRGFRWNTDDITVVFERAEAARTGVMH